MTLDKETSTNIKGLLILLIVLGHNHAIAPLGSFLEVWLYRFHVLIFFVLPFFYGTKNKKLSSDYLVDLIVRNWIPYFFTALMALTATLVTTGEFKINGLTLFAFFNGSSTMTSRYLDAIFLWFLPTYCTFSLLQVSAHSNKWLKIVLCLTGLAGWFMTWEQFEWLRVHSLFGIPMAIKCFALGCLCQYIYKKQYAVYIGAAVFVVLTLLLYKHTTIAFTSIIWPISAFGVILLIRSSLKNKIFQVLGKHSLIIYLIHLFIYHLIESIAGQGLPVGIFNFIVTLAVSTMIAVVIEKNDFIRRLYTPRVLNDIKMILLKNKVHL